ncbi:hypothetical protein PG994_009639 [Apiospora phragmitis]|uniref:Uncharacterized protein n=1 Tax=Apiospora phragmitis TaxID=2905665 RepID=A0ABR1U6R7_9PEZI
MSASAQAISPPAIPASQGLLPVPTQVQILAAFLAALGSGWVVLMVLFVYHFRKPVREDDMAKRIAHRLAASPRSHPREFIDDVVLEEIAIFCRAKEP